MPKSRSAIRFNDRAAHNNRIIALSFLPNDQRLLSASYDKAVSQWNLATGQADPGLDLKHPQQVSSMDVSTDGKLVVTTCFDGVVRLWNVETAQVVQEFRPEGRVLTLLANVSKQFASKKVTNDTLEKAWNLINPEANYQEFMEQGGWSQGVDQLLSQIPEQLGNLHESPRELAQKLADLFTGVSANDLLLPATSSAAISPDNRYIVATNRADRIVHGWHRSGDSYDQPVPFLIDDEVSDAWSATFSPVKTRTDLVVLGFSDARQWNLNTDPNNNSPCDRFDHIERPRRSGVGILLSEWRPARHRSQGQSRPRLERENRTGPGEAPRGAHRTCERRDLGAQIPGAKRGRAIHPHRERRSHRRSVETYGRGAGDLQGGSRPRL